MHQLSDNAHNRNPLVDLGISGSAKAHRTDAHPKKLTLRVRVIPNAGEPFERTVLGREAWALLELLRAGDRGVTPIERPAPRWSHYTWLLRRDGIAVETITEAHDGPFAGTHARYVLRSKVEILEQSGQSERSAA